MRCPCPVYRENPAWTNHALFQQWDEILAFAGPKRMPKLNAKTAKRLVAVEYGTGHYGTVIPTQTKNLVIKITTDPTEASFVQSALSEGFYKYPGLIRYHAIFSLKSKRTTRSRKGSATPGRERSKDIFIIWRDEAYDIGSWQKARSSRTFLANLMAYYRGANGILLGLDHSNDEDATRRRAISLYDTKYAGVATGLTSNPELVSKALLLAKKQGLAELVGLGMESARAASLSMSRDRFGKTVGKSLYDLWNRKGIVLADVHTNNVGRNARKQLVVTDPGHALSLLPNALLSHPKPIEKATRRDWH